jgi:hypothetical protein
VCKGCFYVNKELFESEVRMLCWPVVFSS